jgi:arylsulfatase A-like enzyme
MSNGCDTRLITGRNHHAVGFGVIAEIGTGYPGYDSYIGPTNASVARILKDHGYATSWFGKNHNTPETQYGISGPFDQWPSGETKSFATPFSSNQSIFYILLNLKLLDLMVAAAVRSLAQKPANSNPSLHLCGKRT